jgi:hypothetical protein
MKTKLTLLLALALGAQSVIAASPKLPANKASVLPRRCLKTLNNRI